VEVADTGGAVRLLVEALEAIGEAWRSRIRVAVRFVVGALEAIGRA